MRVREVASREPSWRFGGGGRVPTALSFDPGGALLAIAEREAFYVWDLDTGALSTSVHRPVGAEQVDELLFGPGAGWLLERSAGGASGRQVAELALDFGELRGLAFSADGEELLACGADEALSFRLPPSPLDGDEFWRRTGARPAAPGAVAARAG